jgi:hypothetical protein
MKKLMLVFTLLILIGMGTTLGAQGNAVSLDGVNDYIFMGNLSSLMGTTYSAEIWIKPSVLGGSGDIGSYGRTIFASTNPGPTYGYPMWVTLYGDELAVWAFESTAARNPARTTSGVDIQTGTWYHIAITVVKGGATKLYVNGSVVLSFTNDGEGTWGTQFTVGDLRPDRLICYGGLVDEVRLWNVVRTDSEILNNMSVPISPTPSSMVGYWKLDESVGPTMYDSAGVQQNGTLSGGTIVASDLTLPVELSSFTTVLMVDNLVRITWITQSETDLQGYYLFRGNTPSLNQAVCINSMINATNSTNQSEYYYVDNEADPGNTWYYWLQSVNLDGSFIFHGPVSVFISNGESEEIPGIPVATELHPVYPNPFNPVAYVGYSVAARAQVKVQIFNARGQIVRSYDEGFREIGNYRIIWNGKDNGGSDLPTGMYLIRLTAGNEVCTQKAMLAK